MNQLRKQAIKFRIQGKSYNEIRQELGVAKSTLSLWLRDIILSEKSQNILQSKVRKGVINGLIRRNKFQTHEARERMIRARQESKVLVPKITKRDLLLLGLTLYWAEGHKLPITRNDRELTSHPISFVNADPIMIRAFLRFLREILKIPEKKIVLYMRLYKHINEKGAQKYWKSVTGLPDNSFRKSTYLVSLSSKGRRPFTRLPYGTLQIHVSDTSKFHTLMGFIEGMKEQF